MEAILYSIRAAFANVYSGWILWNLFLAFIPLVLSFWLYRRKTQTRSWLWWAIFVVFIAFLPNAPYVLTDIIHLIRGTRLVWSTWIIALIFIPLHLFAILSGFEAYVVALINQGMYLKRQGGRQYILWAELMTHGLCAIGIYLGRFRRFNSWDLVTAPETVVLSTLNDLTSKRPVIVIIVTFIILAVLYGIFKQLTLGLALHIKYARMGKDVLAELDS